jgi:hypothetical protein
MSKLTRYFAGILLAAGMALAMPNVAQARHWHGGYWNGGWGVHYWRGWRPRVYYGWGVPAYPYYYRPYYRSYYYARPTCRWVRVRVWRHHHRYWRSVRRCW